VISSSFLDGGSGRYGGPTSMAVGAGSVALGCGSRSDGGELRLGHGRLRSEFRIVFLLSKFDFFVLVHLSSCHHKLIFGVCPCPPTQKNKLFFISHKWYRLAQPTPITPYQPTPKTIFLLVLGLGHRT
jgi:hypothetical protein